MPKYIDRKCKKHGLTSFVKEGCGYFRCKKCRMEAVVRRRKKLKIFAIDYKGGKCIKCGYDKCVSALEFHHRDESKKEFGIGGRGITRAWHKVQKELDKCDLVCANCHREIHNTDEV